MAEALDFTATDLDCWGGRAVSAEGELTLAQSSVQRLGLESKQIKN
jgi:hypothetical protein